jgi:hypothetical protein
MRIRSGLVLKAQGRLPYDTLMLNGRRRLCDVAFRENLLPSTNICE